MNESAELTVETPETQIKRAEFCARVTIPGEQFRAIFDLATRVKAFDALKLDHLDSAADREEVRLTGREIRTLLDLALQAKRAGLPPRLRAVRKGT